MNTLVGIANSTDKLDLSKKEKIYSQGKHLESNTSPEISIDLEDPAKCGVALRKLKKYVDEVQGINMKYCQEIEDLNDVIFRMRNESQNMERKFRLNRR